MVSRARPSRPHVLALLVATAGCGTLIGIDDRSLDPGADAGPTGGDGGGRNPDTGASGSSGGTDGAATDSSAVVDSGPVVADFACGTTANCRSPNVCCVHADFSGGSSGGGSGGPPQITIKDRTCGPTCTQSGDFTATLRCAKSADCRAGEVCCFRPTTNTGTSSCETSCNGSFGTFQMCASPADCGGRPCETAFVPPYKSCR